MAVEIIPKIDLTQLQQEFLPSKMDNKLIIVANPVYEGAARFPEYLFIIFNIQGPLVSASAKKIKNSNSSFFIFTVFCFEQHATCR